MAYSFEAEKGRLLRPENTASILRAKDAIDRALKPTGAITYGRAMSLTGESDSFQMIACLDYLVDQGFYFKVPGISPAGQHQILLGVDRG